MVEMVERNFVEEWGTMKGGKGGEGMQTNYLLNIKGALCCILIA